VRIPINRDHPEPRKIARAADSLRRGKVIAYPTDTVYGLGCDIMQKKAVDEVYRIKGMKRDHPLAFICPDLSEIARFAVVDNATYRVLKRSTPGPYTFILSATREVPKILMLKRKTVGIRVPDAPVAQALLHELGNPIVSTSATWNDEIFNDPADIDGRFRGLELVLDAGERPFKELKGAARSFARGHGIESFRWRIFETSGTPAGQATAFGLLGHGSHLSVVGYTPEKVEIRLSNLMALDATAQGNWGCLPELYRDVLDLVLEGRVELAPFVETRPLDTINETFADVHGHRTGRRVILAPEPRE